MTGAVPILKEDGVTSATPFDQGAGRLNLARSLQPGLLFDVPSADYQAFVNGAKPIETLNIPSLAQSRCPLTCSWTRTAQSAMTTTATFTWTAVAAAPGFTVTLDQASYTFAPGAARSFTVTANVSALPYTGQYVFARVILHETTTGIEVQMPVAVIKAGTVFDAEVSLATPRDSGGKVFSGVIGNNYSNVNTTLYGLADPMVTTGLAVGGDDQNPATDPLDPAHGWFLYTDTLPSNLGRYIVTTGNSTASNLDLYILYDRSGDGYDFADGPASDVIARSIGSTADERVDLLDLQAYAGKKFLIAVYNRSGEVDAHFDLTLWRATTTAGSLQVSGVPSTLNAGAVVTPLLKFNKPMLAGSAYYGLVNIGAGISETAVAQVLVNINRTASEVTKSVTPTLVNVGDVVTYTIVLANQDTVNRTFTLTDVLPTGMSYVPGSLTGPAAYDAGLNALLISTTVPNSVDGPNYVVEDSLTNPDLASQSPFGGFLDLTQYGSPQAKPDNTLWIDTVGCPFAFYDNANSTPDSFQYATNGLIGPRAGMLFAPGPVPNPIPTAAVPNGFIALDWSDVSITNTLGFTNSGRLILNLYFHGSGPTCPTDQILAFQYNRLHSQTNPAKVMDVQYLYDFSQPDVHWVLYGPVSGSWGAAAGDVVGAENFSGTLGVAYMGPITTGLVLRYRRELFPAPPITVTFQAAVVPGALPVMTNLARYTVDVPYTVVMSAIAGVELNLPYKMYLLLVRK